MKKRRPAGGTCPVSALYVPLLFAVFFFKIRLVSRLRPFFFLCSFRYFLFVFFVLRQRSSASPYGVVLGSRSFFGVSLLFLFLRRFVGCCASARRRRLDRRRRRRRSPVGVAIPTACGGPRARAQRRCVRPTQTFASKKRRREKIGHQRKTDEPNNRKQKKKKHRNSPNKTNQCARCREVSKVLYFIFLLLTFFLS